MFQDTKKREKTRTEKKGLIERTNQSRLISVHAAAKLNWTKKQASRSYESPVKMVQMEIYV